MATAARPPFQITFPKTKPMPDPHNEYRLIDVSDTVKLLLILFFFCIFPPISFLIILLWIIDEIRAR